MNKRDGSDNANVERKLNAINEQLSSISAKEVLFIITLSFLALFAAVNMCLLILERRNKKKQNSVPQAIVIQPNSGAKSENSKKLTTKTAKVATTSSNYERDVLPSKSMKMKVSISPSMSTASTKAPSSKESVVEEQSRPSEVDKKPSVPLATPVTEVQPVSNPSSAPLSLSDSSSTALEARGSPARPSLFPSPDPFPPPPPSSSTPTDKSSMKSIEKCTEKSERSDSFESFTVPSASASQSFENLEADQYKKREVSESNVSFTVPEQPTPNGTAFKTTSNQSTVHNGSSQIKSHSLPVEAVPVHSLETTVPLPGAPIASSSTPPSEKKI